MDNVKYVKENLLLKCDEPWNFDMKKITIKDTENAVKLALEYRFKQRSFDCDGTLTANTNQLIRCIYRLLWDFDDIFTDRNKKECFKRYAPIRSKHVGLFFQPETITSFLATFNCFRRNDPYLSKKYTCDSTNGLKYSDDKTKNAYDEFVGDTEGNEILKEYCSAVGKIGNMTLTVAGFNFKPPCNDYWDLKIGKQYLENEDFSKTFKNDYINTYFMWDYVDYDVKNEIYIAKPFYEGHEENSFRNAGPKDMEKTELVAKLVDLYVKRRGFLMTLALQLKIAKEELFDKFMTAINNNEIHRMNDAINRVFEICGLGKVDDKVLDKFEKDNMIAEYKMVKEKLNLE